MWAYICPSQPLTIACWRPRCCHLTSGVAWRYKPGIFWGSPGTQAHTHRNPVHALHAQAIVALDRGPTKAPKGLYALSLDLPLPTAAALSAFAPEDQVSAALAHGEAGMQMNGADFLNRKKGSRIGCRNRMQGWESVFWLVGATAPTPPYGGGLPPPTPPIMVGAKAPTPPISRPGGLPNG